MNKEDDKREAVAIFWTMNLMVAGASRSLNRTTDVVLLCCVDKVVCLQFGWVLSTRIALSLDSAHFGKYIPDPIQLKSFLQPITLYLH